MRVSVSGFAFWEHWGAALSDARFASAWVALGLEAAARRRTAGDPPRDLLAAELARGGDAGIEWAFPTASDAAALVPGGPDAWADLWAELARAAPRAPRLRVTGAPPDEAIAPWYRMLSEAEPSPASTSIVVSEGAEHRAPQWPLRIGLLTSEDAKDLPALTGPDTIVRGPDDDGECDLLVHAGNAWSFTAATADRPRARRASVVVLRGWLGRPWRDVESELAGIRRVTSANGWVLLADKAGPEDVAQVVRDAAERLGRGLPLDVAFACAPQRIDVLAGFTPALASSRLEDRRPKSRAKSPDLSARRNAVAAMRPMAERTPAERHLQQRSFVKRDGVLDPADGGFVAGLPAVVRVRIAPLDASWDSLEAPFPSEEVPPDAALTVWLTEPDHLPEGARGHIQLLPDGTTEPCELSFVPRALPGFEGRLTVLHRGRVLQTALLRAVVRGQGDVPVLDGTPKLHAWVPVRQLGEDRERRPFDLAFVLNHDGAGRPLSVALRQDHAWVADLTKSVEVAKEINAALSRVAQSVEDYADGLDGENGRKLLVSLAQKGCSLHLFLVKEQLRASGNHPEVADAEYLQIVSTRTDAVVPFEFIYDRIAPDDDACVCDRWRDAMTTQACKAGCARDFDRTVCPLAFWGLQKVIERHALAPELAEGGRELFLQSEPARESDTLSLGGVAVVGASERVAGRSLAPVLAALESCAGAAPRKAETWHVWPALVHDHHPRLLFALAHTDGQGSNVSLEIGGVARKAIQFDERYVRPSQGDPRPLVALLGCDTAGTALDYGLTIPAFRAAGAAVVVATIATVFGEHAAQVAKRLVEGLLPTGAPAPARLGEALRDLKRKALLDGLLMPLCLVAYGDADWKLSREGGP